MQEEGKTISTKFPYESHYIKVNHYKMHYVEQGAGDPILFVHGIPTHSYLWRNIIPYVSLNARAIAVDLIGMGKSDKPNIKYTVFDHIEFLEGFIKELNLKNLTLVLHGWGSVIGFEVARRNEDRIKAIAFYESHLRSPTRRSMLSLPIQEFTALLDLPDGGYDVIMNSNYFVNRVLPRAVMRKLSDEEMKSYLEPFEKAGSTKPLWQYMQDVPLGEKQTKVTDMMDGYSQWLQTTQIPKLLFYTLPGFVATIDSIKWASEHLPKITVVDLGEGLHCMQETDPHAFGTELKNWYNQLK